MTKETKAELQEELVRTRVAFASHLCDGILSERLLLMEKSRKNALLHLAAEHYKLPIAELKELILADWLDKCLVFPDLEGAPKRFELVPSPGEFEND